MPRPRGSAAAATNAVPADTYEHVANEAVQRPDVGLQQEFTKQRRARKTYRYDDSLDPQLSWDENRERELAEWLLGLIARAADQGEKKVFATEQVWAGGGVRVQSLKAAVQILKSLSEPFFNWAGKCERHELSVPTVPLFVHERHSTKAIIYGLKNRRAKGTTLDLFGDPRLDLTDKLAAYEHRGPWTNRLILGDSLLVMNSLLEYEGLGRQVQMIYIDPPYGVKFGSNFQPFVRRRDMSDKHGKDDFMTREPEMVKAYRDTWELGLHSYLTYLRDRLLLARELLHESGSVFVQISDENLHHVREVMDEVLDTTNFVALIAYQSSGGFEASTLSRAGDFILWYARDKTRLKYQPLFIKKRSPVGNESSKYDQIELPDGSRRAMSAEEKRGEINLPSGARIFRYDNIISQGASENTVRKYIFKDVEYDCGPNSHWKASVPTGMDRLAQADRIGVTSEGKLSYVRYFDDFPLTRITSLWSDIGGSVQSRYICGPNRQIRDPTLHSDDHRSR
jgi:adenine-specific DNA-methyltransferase